METNTRSRKELQIRNNYRSRTSGLKISVLIGKSIGDYGLKKKIRESDMSVEAITDAVHEYMYEKLNDPPETEEEKKSDT